MIDEVTRAVLAREEVARYMRASGDHVDREARERIFAYLDELRTTQRYTIYRVLKHPLYPILRKVERHVSTPRSCDTRPSAGVSSTFRTTRATSTTWSNRSRSRTRRSGRP